MLRMIWVSGLLLASAFNVCADSLPQGHRLADMTFDMFDTTKRGYVDFAQLVTVGEDIFVSMDADSDNKITLPEFLAWDYGFRNIADDTGKTASYQTALKIVHSFWDSDGDGTISHAEFRRANIADFQRADVDNNAILSKEEFLKSFSVLVALRAALNPGD